MKDKEKQIEEMFQDIAKVMCDCDDKERFFRPRRYECRKCYMHTVIQHIVFFLRNSDYRKLPEDSVIISKERFEALETIEKYHIKSCGKDSVVLSREEYERLKGERKLCDNCGTYFQSAWTACPKCGTKPSDYERGSKETAEKWKVFIKSLFNIERRCTVASNEKVHKAVDEFAKQFGVEIKE